MTFETTPSESDKSAQIADFTSRAAKGDRIALGELYRIYCDPLWHHIHARYSGGNQTFTDDATAAVWERVCRDIAVTYDPERGKFVTWLYVVAKTISWDMSGRQQKGRELEVSAHLLAHGYSAASQERSPEDQAVLREESERVASRVSRLPRRQSDAIMLTVFGGLKTADAAEVMGTTANNVKQARWLGLQNLKATVPRSEVLPMPVAQIAAQPGKTAAVR